MNNEKKNVKPVALWFQSESKMVVLLVVSHIKN